MESNLNSTPSADRIHIGFFGCSNAGKSSLLNAVTGQEISIVSEIKGTTTDPVKKAMEILPIGAVEIFDT
ncbi:MAG: 50S ribosome-binding GTPase, partial [Ruminococcus sp.]|nr:50S ribosome-binding GTPase [Ruminococcus sp.]